MDSNKNTQIEKKEKEEKENSSEDNQKSSNSLKNSNIKSKKLIDDEEENFQNNSDSDGKNLAEAYSSSYLNPINPINSKENSLFPENSYLKDKIEEKNEISEFKENSAEDPDIEIKKKISNENLENKENKENNEESTEIKPWEKYKKDPDIMKKGSEVFVGNLGFEITEADLYENFNECGEITDVRK